MRHLAMLLTSAAILRTPPEGQSAAADGADAPIETAQESTDKPLATEVVEQPASTDTVESQAPETSDEQAPEPTDPPDDALMVWVEEANKLIENLVSSTTDLVERVQRIEQRLKHF